MSFEWVYIYGQYLCYIRLAARVSAAYKDVLHDYKHTAEEVSSGLIYRAAGTLKVLLLVIMTSSTSVRSYY